VFDWFFFRISFFFLQFRYILAYLTRVYNFVITDSLHYTSPNLNVVPMTSLALIFGWSQCIFTTMHYIYLFTFVEMLHSIIRFLRYITTLCPFQSTSPPRLNLDNSDLSLIAWHKITRKSQLSVHSNSLVHCWSIWHSHLVLSFILFDLYCFIPGFKIWLELNPTF
jgi:hypothetical protein